MHSKTLDSKLFQVRYPIIDWFRGSAILLMVIYHLCYDLDVFGYIDTQFGVGYWIPFRYLIVISFLLLVGISLQFVHANGINWLSIKRRTIQLLAAALAVSISSFIIASEKTTLFGILHLILFSSWLALLFINKPWASLAIGTIIFLAGHLITSTTLEIPWLHWIGMVVSQRPALDYAPVFPWFGVVLWGCAIGYAIQYSNKIKMCLLNIEVKNNVFNRGLNWAGKHSLIIYLLHQPLLYGVFLFISRP